MDYVDTNEEPMLNVFYYREVTGASGNAVDCIDAFEDDVVPKIQAIWHADTNTTKFTCINGMDNDDASVQFINTIGINPITFTLPPNLAAGLRNPPLLPGQQYSYKRFGGVVNDLSTIGTWGSTFDALLATLGTQLGADINTVLGNFYRPVLLTGGFRLGVTPVESRPVTGNWQYNDWPTHQDTRQIYNWVAP